VTMGKAYEDSERRLHWYRLAEELGQRDDFLALIEAERRDAVEMYKASRPLLDRARLDQLWGWAKSGKRSDSEGGEYYLMSVENVDGFTDAVVRMARPMPTREQIMSAVIGEIYEDPEPLVRQGMPEEEWRLLSIAADAVVALLNKPRT
jgi:hypothetical protein